VFVSFQVVFFILKVGLRRDINIDRDREDGEEREKRRRGRGCDFASWIFRVKS